MAAQLHGLDMLQGDEKAEDCVRVQVREHQVRLILALFFSSGRVLESERPLSQGTDPVPKETCPAMSSPPSPVARGFAIRTKTNEKRDQTANANIFET